LNGFEASPSDFMGEGLFQLTPLVTGVQLEMHEVSAEGIAELKSAKSWLSVKGDSG
jgi:hypothetical protein